MSIKLEEKEIPDILLEHEPCPQHTAVNDFHLEPKYLQLIIYQTEREEQNKIFSYIFNIRPYGIKLLQIIIKHCISFTQSKIFIKITTEVGS